MSDDRKPVRIIHDLDLIDSEKIGIKWKGKTYSIDDLKVGQGMQISVAYSKLVDLELKISQGEEIDQVALARAYYDVLSVVISEITPSDILEMGQKRINLILSLISRKVTGDPALAEEIQKKKLLDETKLSISNSFPRLHSFATSLVSRIKKS